MKMVRHIFKTLSSVKAKLFVGFFSMVIIIALLGGYAFNSIDNASDVVEDTFDRPLMAVNFARSASQVFGQLEIAVLQTVNSPQDEQAPSLENILPLLNQFKEDIKVAEDRSISARATSFFDDLSQNLKIWEEEILSTGPTPSEYNIKSAQTYANIIKEQLDIIVELQMNESFRARENAISRMNQIKVYNLWAVGIALLIAFLLSIWIAFTIIKPLKAAALAASNISAGDFNAVIPVGGDDETGVLLKTMAVMQDNIRSRVDKEESAKTLAQQRLSDSLQNSKDAILLTNKYGNIIVSNPRVREVFPSFRTIDLINEKFLDHFDKRGYSLNDEAIFLKSQSEIEFKDGRWARVSASKTQEGGWLYIWADITEVKQYEEKLTLAKEDAEAANKAKSLFLAAMSHELRTPLNAVIGFSEALKGHFAQPGGNPDYAKMIMLISQSGAQLVNIVKDILMVADSETIAEIPIDQAEINLADIISASIDIISFEAEQKNVRVLWEAPQNECVILGDASRLERLLLNLLSNSIKYNNKNGLIKIQLNQEANGEIRLDVIDNGIGIDEVNLECIMEPFVQVDTGHTRKYDGLGVGLTLVNKIVQSHGGRLNIISKLDRGTCVSVYLPRHITARIEFVKSIAS